MISIIVRTKNEERWISSCLEAISRQTIKDYEVVLVDNASSDKTVAKAMQHGVVYVAIEKFTPGAAINRGIEASRGDVIVCLSGHCIPVDEFWLENLVRPLTDETVAGVYGRQEPLAFTSDLDKRDLLITFGLDQRTQIKDSFFHNANSAFRRAIWEKFPFDEETPNIEDRIWANQVQQENLIIFYEPSSSVYHYHGIHHEGDRRRCGNIIQIIESVGQQEIRTSDNNLDASCLNVVAIIPIRDEGLRLVANRALYEYTIEHALRSNIITTIAVSTDSAMVAQKARNAGVEFVLEREPEQSRFDVILELLMRSSLEHLEREQSIPDILVMLEPTFPFRDDGLIDRLISHFVEGGFDTVIPARKEYNSCWMEEEGKYRRIDHGYIARKYKTPVFIGLKGLCCVCSPSTIRRGELFGDNVGLVGIEEMMSTFEVRTESDATLAERLLDRPQHCENR